jgi:phosphomannomutase
MTFPVSATPAPTLFSFFKAYDMRGTMDILTPEVYYWLGRSFVELILVPENIDPVVIIAHDCRINGPEYYKHLAAGIRAAGGAVVSLGLATTDLVYAAALVKQAPAMMITASHNPAEFNGCKIVKQAPLMLGLDSGLSLVRDYILERMGTAQNSYTVGEIPQSDEFKTVANKYLKEKIEVVSGLSATPKSIKVVVDTANGTAGPLMQQMQEWYPAIDWIPLFWEVDGSFPNHSSDPTPEENRRALAAKVQATHADFGAFIDGDGDRCAFVDEHGELIAGDFIVALFAEYFLNKNTSDNTDIVYIEPNSRAVSRSIAAAGGNPIISKQGHSFVKVLMKEHDAVYGGEGSAHHYFREFGYMDSGIISLALFAKIYIGSSIPASQLTQSIATGYSLSGERNYRLNPDQTVPDIIELLKAAFPDAQHCELDGLTISYPDWRCNIRGSNTEPLLRFNIETNTPADNPLQKLALVLEKAAVDPQNQL